MAVQVHIGEVGGLHIGNHRQHFQHRAYQLIDGLCRVQRGGQLRQDSIHSHSHTRFNFNDEENRTQHMHDVE